MPGLSWYLDDLLTQTGPKLGTAFAITPSTLAAIFVCTSIIYLFLVVFMQFSRRPFVGQSSMFDLVFMLVIANGVQNAMVVGDNSLAGGFVSAGTLFAWDGALGWVRRHFPRSRRFLGGERILVLRDGRPLDDAMAREGLVPADLEELLEDHGLASLAQCRKAYVEIDGSVTIIPYPDAPADRPSQLAQPSIHA